ncbi:uncharacterized protein LOC111825017 [Myotis lucifugus]|uniref:uncharacterized protein LOC111825017 n=1 Tax=Myotis lucifugus TaxID=59463 RepID=UPI000CCC0B3E|nr:uncharacterized protein LOC111825017 [Myotis lucifugus]
MLVAAQPAVAAWAGLGPGPNWEARGADLPKQSCWAGGGGAREAAGSWSGGGRRTGPARPPPPPPLETAPRGARPRAGSQGGATERSCAPPFLLCLQRSAPTKGQACGRGAGGGGTGRSEPLAPKLGSRLARRRRAGGRCLPRAFSARGEEEPGLPQPIGEPPGAAPPCFGAVSADGKLSGVWQTWCSAPVPVAPQNSRLHTTTPAITATRNTSKRALGRLGTRRRLAGEAGARSREQLCVEDGLPSLS